MLKTASKEFAAMSYQDATSASNAGAPSRRSDYEFDFLVFIGRFQPFHLGHKTIIDLGLKKARHLILLIGSAKEARSTRNPFTWEERAEMVLNAYSADDRERIHATPLLDLPYAEQSWIRNVQMSVQGISCQYQVTGDVRIGLIGHAKDHTSYYLNMFPQWGHVDAAREFDMDATTVRTAYLRGENFETTNLPVSTLDFLDRFQDSEGFKVLEHEQAIVDQYKKAWEQAPYVPTFVTVDSVVVQSGHILLIKRRSAPGKNLWALPGGFIDPFERLEDGAIRELREETKITVPAPVLKGSIKVKEVFDDPYRSERGRTITTAFLIELAGDKKGLPRIKGSDDAAKARWVPIADINSEQLFEDHFHIIQTLLRDTLK